MRPYVRTIAAGLQADIPVKGNFVFIQSSNLPVNVRAERREVGLKEGGGADIEVSMGNRQAQGYHRDFDHLLLTNRNASSITVTILAGYGSYQAPLTTISTGGNNTLGDAADVTAGAAATSLSAADGDRTKIHIKALATNTVNFRVGSATITATRGAQLQPGEGLTLETAAEVFIIREGAGTVNATFTTERNT